MNGFVQLLEESREFQELLSAFRAESTPVSLTGADSAQRIHLSYALLRSLPVKGVLFVTANESAAERACEDFSFFTKRALFLPAKELVFHSVDAMSREITHRRLNVLNLMEKSEVITLSVDSLLSFVMPKNELMQAETVLSVGDTLSLDELCEKLVGMGYERVELVEGSGQFAVRGGIVDVFSPNYDRPHRFELFGDEIDSVREFDVLSQISEEKKDSFTVIPCTEQEAAGSVLSYIPKDWLVVLDQPARIRERAENLVWEAEEAKRAIIERGDDSLKGKKLLHEFPEVLSEIEDYPVLELSVLSHAGALLSPKELLSVSSRILNSYSGNPEFLFEDLAKWKKENYRTVILAGSQHRAGELESELSERDIIASRTDSLDTLPPRGSVVLMPGSLTKGFSYPLIQTVIVSDKEIFPAEKKRRKRRSASDGTRINSYTELEIGDYVVHRTHGIGKYLGIRKMKVQGIEKDYLQLKYRGEEFLYVPVGQMDSISKYSGGEGKEIRLNKLDGMEWKRTKEKVRQSVKALAFSLVDLYAARRTAKGHAFRADTPWQREFEDKFLYEETEDQLECIAEMKRDMESDRPMDRLLCGDVGYGKTEVAIRGAFKCVMDGMQAAHLVPTTILAMQHYKTYTERMKDYPVKVEMLSRFRTPAEQRKVLKGLESGEIDIVIGTHKLLQESVKFKKLGLLIVDEEQRFGVGHKERIKNIKKDVDVLTLSATPIPRTLHMSMVGIRDMSLITAPPENRYPVATYVLEYDMSVVMEAIRKEIGRGGQVYYLYNNIQSIYRVADELSHLMPDLRIAVAHGRMHERELEDIMLRVMQGEIDVLVCTTIIETGMDIANVNTIIVENADRMGLSQLYQLRGRVGRSNRRAYAYLTYRKNKVLDEVAEKRLRAICEFTEFGAGYKIALRDLEIRGAGNVLGPEQHGFMDAVGYDVYCDILADAVREAQGLPPTEVKEDTYIDLIVSARIPESYIKNANLRIEMYKRIASIMDLADRYAVEEELEDRYGDPPIETVRLIEISYLRVMATGLGIGEIRQSDESIRIQFAPQVFPDFEVVSKVIGKRREKIVFSAKNPISLICFCRDTQDDAIRYIKNLLQDLKDLSE